MKASIELIDRNSWQERRCFYKLLCSFLMDETTLLQITENIFSDDLIASKEAKRELKKILSPQSIIHALFSEQRETIKKLLGDVEQNASAEVNKLVCDVLETAFKNESSGHLLLQGDKEGLLWKYLLRAFASNETAIGLGARKAVLALLSVLEAFPSHEIYSVVDDWFANDKVLRFVDYDNVESDENKVAIRFLIAKTSLVSFIVGATLNSFEEDPLLLGNYLVLCGVLTHADQTKMSPTLLERVSAALGNSEDSSTWISVSQFCFWAMWKSEENSHLFGKQWLSQALKVILDEESSESLLPFASQLAWAACSTSHGFREASKQLTESVFSSLFMTGNTERIAASLRMLYFIHQSPFFNREAVDLTISIREAWQFHVSTDERVRLALWDAIGAIIAVFPDCPLVNAYASFLGSSKSETVGVREKQLRVAEILTQFSLPYELEKGLNRFVAAGLYPPGSSGVASLP